MTSSLAQIDLRKLGIENARHLLNRAGFGVPRARVSKLAEMSPEAAVDCFINFEQFADLTEPPNFIGPAVDLEEAMQMKRQINRSDGLAALRDFRQQEREKVENLKSWWFNLMRTTNYPLREKMVLFWSGHFATSAEKVQLGYFNYHINQVFRDYGMGEFGKLVSEVGRSPAMLRYLDNVQNVKGHPNENWARELMELFTLGIGHYTERDIKEAARAFTGWGVQRAGFFFDRSRHDTGDKLFLGRRGEYSGDDIIEIIMTQRRVCEFIGRKLWEYFVYENPSTELVERIAQEFRIHKHNIRHILRTIFLSKEFYSDRAKSGLVKSPVQLLVKIFDDLQIQLNRTRGERLINGALRAMGQDLFYPPNVKGWEGNRAWINTNTLLFRYNITAFLVNGALPAHQAPMRLDAVQPASTPQAANAPFDVRAFFKREVTSADPDPLIKICTSLVGSEPTSEQLKILRRTVPNGIHSAGEDELRSVVHLVLSMAEYQLC